MVSAARVELERAVDPTDGLGRPGGPGGLGDGVADEREVAPLGPGSCGGLVDREVRMGRSRSGLLAFS
jgi:hypothetical protein